MFFISSPEKNVFQITNKNTHNEARHIEGFLQTNIQRSSIKRVKISEARQDVALIVLY